MDLIPLDPAALSAPAELLAFDEALLDFCESSDHPGFITFWESTTYFVVLGYGKKLTEEVYADVCHDLGIPILRRTSGGGTVLQGPGCFNYSLILPINSVPELETITGANRFIMERIRSAIAPLLSGTVAVQGHTDLTLDGLKFSGNAQRRKRRCLLFHGSFLLNFNLGLITSTLRLPPQQPDYRRNRPHDLFIANCQLAPAAIQSALCAQWNASPAIKFDMAANQYAAARTLAAAKYAQDDWNRRF